MWGVGLLGAALLALLIAATGCTRLGGMELEGTITGLPGPAQGQSGLVEVKGVFNGQGTPHLVHLGVGPNTPLFDRRPGRSGPARVPFATLQVGQRVRARVTGGVQETHPARASAAQMEILP